jgi:MFS superfamily sulfate permease-like transporter
MDGFVMGLAIFVSVGQLNKLFGVPKPDGNTVEKFLGIVKELPQANWVTFLVGASALALLFLLPRLSKKLPAGLMVLFGYILLSSMLNLEETYGVEVVGVLPQGLPLPSIPRVPFTTYLAMILPAIGVLLVAFSEALGVAHEFAEKHGYEISADQELNAHAITNLTSALFGGMIAAGGMSASAVKEGAGARSQIANLAAWIATIVTLLFLTPLFAPLPEAVLAALIIHALWHIIASRKLYKLSRASRVEFWFGVLSLGGVLLIDVLQGMVIGLVGSLLFVIYRSSRPHIASLGRVPGAPGAYSDMTRHPENTPVPRVLIVRIDAQLYYANAMTVKDRIKTMIAEMETPPGALIIDMSAQDLIDLTSQEVTKSLVKELHDKGIAIFLADVHAPVAAVARKSGMLETIGEDHLFTSVDAAVRFIEGTA